MEPCPLVVFRRAVRCLRAGCPVEGVRVRRRRTNLLGHATRHGRRRMLVVVNPDLPRTSAIDTLIHEWAHVLAWRRHGPDIPDHGEEWGRAYADAYCAFHVEWERRGYHKAG